MKLFENRKDFPYLRWAEGFCIGIIAVTGVALATPTKQPVVQIVKVPVVKVIEKKVIVNKPVYLSKYDKNKSNAWPRIHISKQAMSQQKAKSR